ncbi:hypothetical protein AMECASPLE_026097 [Ameca splendens]|uniref:Uncharacterized protein n=1 Tax=Ameca splendens TaxID=208324 RepID=A0ABV0YS80_9TELE
MLKRHVNHDSPTTSRDLRYSGWILSTPEALSLRNFLTTSVTSAWVVISGQLSPSLHPSVQNMRLIQKELAEITLDPPPNCS